MATMPVVAGVGDLRPDVHVRVHASDAVNVLLTLRGHLGNLQAELVEGLTSLLPMKIFFLRKWRFRINFWAFFKVNMLLSRKTAMLDRDAILLEKLVILILRLRLDHLFGGIWHFCDKGFLESLRILKIGLMNDSCILFFEVFCEQVFERKVLNGTIVDASTVDGFRQI